jgi:hypothetical protein
MLKVGISEVDITPAPGKPRAGMPYPQKGQGAAWPLMGRIFIFDDGLSQAAIITLDLLFLTTATVTEYRRVLADTAGIRPNHIMIACTHTHWTPHTTAIMDEDADFDYLDFVRERLVQGMAQAWEERQPARLKVGKIDAPGWAFNRRPLYRTPYGEQVGTQGPHWIPEFVRMEGPDDPELRILMAETLPAADGVSRPLGGLVNFTCHTTVGPDEPLYSADYPGPLTARLAQETGGIFGFLQGCAGNIWQMNMSQKREPIYQENGSAHTQKMGAALAAKALEALTSARTLEEPKVHTDQPSFPTDRSVIRTDRSWVRSMSQVLHIAQRRPTPAQVALAKRFLENRPPDLDLQEHMLQIYGHPYTFYTDWGGKDKPEVQGSLLWQEDWFARGLLGLWEWQRRAGGRQLLESVEVQAIAIGDIAFVGYPAEYFVEYGLRTKSESPFPDTFVSELANGWHGYVPTPEAYAHGGYEPRLGDANRLVEDAGERLCETGLSLLRHLWSRS